MIQNHIMACIILVIALALIITKRYLVLSLWDYIPVNIVQINKLSNKNYEVIYLYKIKNKKYKGRLVQNSEPNTKLNVYVHKLNHHLTVPHIPITLSDYGLILNVLLASVYLYLYQCECLPNSINKVLGIPLNT